MIKKNLVILAATASLLSGCAAPLLLGGAAAGGYMAAQERGARSALMDTKVKTHIVDRLAGLNYKYIGAVQVDVLQGNVLLTGVIPSGENRQKILHTVMNTPDVKKVYDEMLVAGEYTTKEKAKDTWLATQIRTKMATSSGVFGINYMVSVVKNQVYILGIAADDMERERALHVARTVKGVIQVHNYIVVSASESANRKNNIDPASPSGE